MVALYFAIYTLTSIGFGDITAQNLLEFYMMIFMMVMGSVFWAYIIGAFCNIVSSADMFGNEFRQRMDELNRMMADRGFDKELAMRCRM